MKLAQGTLLLILSLISASAHADFYCENHPKELEEYVSLSLENGVYTVEHWGHSRNSYKAEYNGSKPTTTRYGSVSDLTKSHDLSTWHDMPDTLELKYFVTEGEKDLILSGLEDGIGLEGGTWFHANDCKSIKSKPIMAAEPHCIYPLQQQCGTKCISARAECNE